MRVIYDDLTVTEAEAQDGGSFRVSLMAKKILMVELWKAKFLGIMICVYVINDAPSQGLDITWIKE